MWNIKQNSAEDEETIDATIHNEEDEIQIIKKELTKPVAKSKGGSNLK